jgi:hypothetical protein
MSNRTIPAGGAAMSAEDAAEAIRAILAAQGAPEEERPRRVRRRRSHPSNIAARAAGYEQRLESLRRSLAEYDSARAGLEGVANPAIASADGSAEIIALSAEILHREAIAAPGLARYKLLVEQFDGSGESPHRSDATREAGDYCQETGLIFDRMMAIPAATPAARVAKVKAFLVRCGGDDWRGPDEPLDWIPATARALLAEFAGMSAEEVANV